MAKNLLSGEKGATCRATIFSKSEKEYGSKYKDHLLQQYKFYIDSVAATSDLKLKINTYFLTINTALITATGLTITKISFNFIIWHLILPLVGVVISFIWLMVTYAYKERNVAKLRIIHCIEEKLPLAVYSTEWQMLDENHKNIFKDIFFKIDLFTPFVFMVSYLLFIIFS